MDSTGDPKEPVPVPITSELDLHGFPPRDVPEIMREYLSLCRDRGILEVRLIHGKGQSVVARTVHSTLSRLPGILRYSLATPAFGGHGATFVRLEPKGNNAAEIGRELSR